MDKTLFSILLMLFASALPSFGQTWKQMDADSLFLTARQEVYDAETRAKGKEKLEYIVAVQPTSHDVKVLLGRVYAWDGAYDKARTTLRNVLIQNPEHHDAITALIDVESWSDNHLRALEMIRKRLVREPEDTTALLKSAEIYRKIGQGEKALEAVKALLRIDPTHAEGLALYAAIQKENTRWTAAVTFSADVFSRIFEPAGFLSAEINRKNSWGSAHLRYNRARRFGIEGGQIEADFYPTLGDRMYAYLHYGYSPSDLFPEHRMASELFFNMGSNVEASGGVRYMDFENGEDVVLFTASAGIYIQNYWILIRPYLAPKDGVISTSVTAQARRYFKDADTFLGVHFGLGFSPDVRTLQRGTLITEEEIHLLQSRRAGLSWQNSFRKGWITLLSVEFCRQELGSTTAPYVTITNSSLSLRKRF